LFGLSLVPTVFGFDPRLQFLHEDDAVRVLEQATLTDRPGTFNVAGDGIVLLSQAIAIFGKVNAPLIPFVAPGLAMAALNRVATVGFPQHLTRLLQFGRVVDTTALRDHFGVMEHSTLEAVREHAKQSRVRARVEDKPYPNEAELEEFLRSRRVASNGHHTEQPGRRTRRVTRPAPRRRSKAES
jgi:hypothetical protein